MELDLNSLIRVFQLVLLNVIVNVLSSTVLFCCIDHHLPKCPSRCSTGVLLNLASILEEGGFLISSLAAPDFISLPMVDVNLPASTLGLALSRWTAMDSHFNCLF